MKKVVLAAFFVAASAVAFSQGFSFGVKAGANVSSEHAKGADDVSLTSQAKLVGGVYATLMFSEHLGIQPELLYSGQGAKVSFDGTSQKDAYAYLNIPILLRYQVVPLVHIMAGPQLGILASAKEKDDQGNSIDIKDTRKSSDIGIAFGAGIDLPFGLNADLRYVAGLVQHCERRWRRTIAQKRKYSIDDRL